MRRVLRDNGLSITLFAAFVVFLVLQSVFGWLAQQDEDRQHGQPGPGYGTYLTSGEFAEATFENWESEFLQIGSYVVLTALLIQRGSPESKPAPEDEPAAAGGAQPPPPAAGAAVAAAAPPVRPRWRRLLRDNGLFLTFLVLFVGAFVGHLFGGAAAYNAERAAHGEPPVSTVEFLGGSEFWFQSMQNWQSEFFAIALLVVLTIKLRQKGSPQSKPVED